MLASDGLENGLEKLFVTIYHCCQQSGIRAGKH